MKKTTTTDIKKPTEFLCKKCLKAMREYDNKRRKVWKLKIKERSPQENGKVKISK
jgi:hypothetical protein